MTIMPKRILVVDDHEVMRKGAQKAFDEAPGDYEVIFAIDGKDGIKKLHNSSTLDAVWCDFSMPNTNGEEMLEHAKSIGSKVPFVFVIEDLDEATKTRLMSKGACAVLDKNSSVAFILYTLQLAMMR